MTMRSLRGRICVAAAGMLLGAPFVGGCAVADGAPPAAASRPLSTASAGSVPAPSQTVSAHPDLSAYRSVRTHPEVAGPVRLRVPAIDVSTGLESLRKAADQSIEVPRKPGSAGWWADGPRPGQPGPAVILGHVDSKTGPAVFFRLDELQPGADLLVDRADGSTVRFVVTEVHDYPKDEFPSELVYYPTLEPELRLVTCGGPINPSTGHYRDNLVVFAAQAP